jgi:hypothetical protein
MPLTAIILAASVAGLSTSSEPAAPKGWVCVARECHPLARHWLGFRLGMTKDAALGAAADARIKGYFQEDPEAAPLGNCNKDSCEDWDFAELRDQWYFLLSGTRCEPAGELQHLLLEFGNGRLIAVISDCKPSPADLLPSGK